jgi:hypothetical protein
MIVHTLCWPAFARKFGRSNLGHRLELDAHFTNSGTQPKPAATQHAEAARTPVGATLPTTSDPEVYIEATVQRLLQELQRRLHHAQQSVFERTKRKVTA